MITVEHLSKNFGSAQVLRDVSFSVPPGEVLALLGPNGAGKTTAVSIIATLLKPSGGKVHVNGASVVSQPDKVRSSIGLSGQYAAVDEKLTGYENMYLIGRLYGMSRKQAKTRARELLNSFRLIQAANKVAGAYSGGMRRRLDLAGALLTRPEAIILDEPTTGLDPRSRQDTWNLVRSMAEAGTAVLLTTQYLEEADQLAEKIVVLNEGKVAAEGTATELKSLAGDDRVDVAVQNPAELEQAKIALARVHSGNGPVPDAVSTDLVQSRVSIAARNGHADLLAAIDELSRARIQVSEVALRRPTLDEVFLHLTGQARAAVVPEAAREDELVQQVHRG